MQYIDFLRQFLIEVEQAEKQERRVYYAEDQAKIWLELLRQYKPHLCQVITGSKIDPYYGRVFPADFVRNNWHTSPPNILQNRITKNNQ